MLVGILSVIAASCSSGGTAAPSATSRPVRRSATGASSRAASPKTVTGVKGAAPSATPKERQLCLALASGLRGYSSAAGGKRTPSSLRAAFAQLQTEEPKVLAAAPAKVHGAFEVFFGYLNHFYRVLSAVGFDYAKLSVAEARSLSQASTRVATASATIQSYLVATCRTSIATQSGGTGSSGSATASS